MNLALAILSLLSFACFMFLSLKKELHIMQLNSYRNERYWKWTKENLKKKWLPAFLLAAIGLVLAFVGFEKAGMIVWIIAFVLGCVSFLGDKPKKALVFTQRATRLFVAAIVVVLVEALLAYFLFPTPIVGLVLLLLASFAFAIQLAANTLLIPIENYINQWYINDAKKILKNFPSLKILAITGSYGKTSTKHFLTGILSEKFNVLMTPGSYNTPMGVVKTVRMMLKPTHEVFVVEMGAKQIGDIKELCDIAHPQIGIITAIGEQHLETFGSLANVQRTKYELAEALPSDGLAILNGDYDTVRNYDLKNKVATLFYTAEDNSGAYSGRNVRYSSRGMSFDLYKGEEKIVELETRLMGLHNVSNIVASCCAALQLGMKPQEIKYGVKSLEPVQHRLQVKRNQGGITIIDDAFNSNPEGAAMALDVLGKIEGKKKIIITPGMVELGDKQYEYNKIFGEQIAKVCDYVVLVGPNITKPIQDGLAAANYDQSKVYIAQNLTDGNQKMRTILEAGDVVLYENDLPDTYNE